MNWLRLAGGSLGVVLLLQLAGAAGGEASRCVSAGHSRLCSQQWEESWQSQEAQDCVVPRCVVPVHWASSGAHTAAAHPSRRGLVKARRAGRVDAGA